MDNLGNAEDRLNQLEKNFEKLEKKSSTNVDNCLSLLSIDTDQTGLYYIMTDRLLFIFSAKSLSVSPDFMQDFLFNYLKKRSKWSFGKLNPSCFLYREHYKSFAHDDVLLYKYLARGGLINKSTVSKDKKTDELYIESQYLGRELYSSESDENNIVYADQPKRKILKGITVNKYLANKSAMMRRLIFRNVFDYLFSTFPAESGDKSKVSGVLLDAHMDNIIVNDDGFHLIDKDVICSADLSKSQVLYRNFKSSPNYKYFLDYYGLADESEEYLKSYPLEHRDTEEMQRLRVANASLLKKYFSEVGLTPHERYNVKLTVYENDFSKELVSYFDADWYEKQYHPNFPKDCPNVSGCVHLFHYLNIGWKKGYNPSPKFDGNAYLEQNEDVKKSGINPLWHYVNGGKDEGRSVFAVK